MPEKARKTKKNILDRQHELMPRFNSEANPVILNSATVLRQPNGLPFNAQLVLNINQAKILIKIIERLQAPIKQTIENEKYRNNPLQLPLFAEEESNTVKLDFELSEFGVNKANYKKLKQDLAKLINFLVVQDTIYFNEKIGDNVEAKELKSLIAGVMLPDKYARYVSVKIDKDVAKLLVNVAGKGYTKYLLEIAMQSSSKYTLLIYQLISRWQDKKGFKWTIENFKKQLGIEDKYQNWNDLNARVIRPAYEELYEKSNIWFEYQMEKKDKKPHFVIFKIISGYYQISGNSNTFDFDSDLTFTVDYSTLNERQRNCLDLLKRKLCINDSNISGEIVSERIDDFYIWYEANEKKIDKMEKPGGALLHFLGMTASKGWKPRTWQIVTQEPPKITNAPADYSDLWNRILKNLSASLPIHTLETWFNPIIILDVIDPGQDQPKEILLRVPSKFVYEQIESNFLEELKEAIFKEPENIKVIKYTL